MGRFLERDARSGHCEGVGRRNGLIKSSMGGVGRRNLLGLTAFDLGGGILGSNLGNVGGGGFIDEGVGGEGRTRTSGLGGDGTVGGVGTSGFEEDGAVGGVGRT